MNIRWPKGGGITHSLHYLPLLHPDTQADLPGGTEIPLFSMLQSSKTLTCASHPSLIRHLRHSLLHLTLSANEHLLTTSLPPLIPHVLCCHGKAANMIKESSHPVILSSTLSRWAECTKTWKHGTFSNGTGLQFPVLSLLHLSKGTTWASFHASNTSSVVNKATNVSARSQATPLLPVTSWNAPGQAPGIYPPLVFQLLLHHHIWIF